MIGLVILISCYTPPYEMQANYADCIDHAGDVNASIHACCGETYTPFTQEWEDCVYGGANAVMFMREQICVVACPNEGLCDMTTFADCETLAFDLDAYGDFATCQAAAIAIKDIDRACCGDVWGDYVEARDVCRAGATQIKQDRVEACRQRYP